MIICTSDEVSVTLTEPGAPTLSTSITELDSTYYLCENESTILTYSGTGTPRTTLPFESSDTTIATVDDSGEVTGISEGIVTITYTEDNGCSDSIDITIANTPLVTANASATEICLGESITLFGTTNDGLEDELIWSSTSYTDPVLDGVGFTPSVAGTYTFTVEANDYYYFHLIGGSYCSSTDTITITVNEPPTVIANASQTEICLGDSVTFTGSGADSYTWDNGVTDNTTFTPTATGTVTYTVTGTDTNGCVNTATIDVTVNELPTVIANASQTEICIGDSVTFTGSGADTYTWDSGVTDNTTFTPTATGTVTYTVTGTDTNGCINTATVDVTVNELPTVVANVSQTEICIGDSVTFAGSGADTYTWDNGVTDNITFTPTATGTVTYTVTGTDTNGCVNTATIDVTVYELPIAPKILADDYCSDDTINEIEIPTLEALVNDSNTETVRWYSSIENLIDRNYDNVGLIYEPGVTETGTYTYYATSYNDNGCESEFYSTITFEIHQSPDFIYTDDILEEGEQYPFNVVDVNKYQIQMFNYGETETYTYNVIKETNFEYIDVSSTGEFEIEQSDFYIITATSNDGCEVSYGVDIEYIDIEIPNVFNPQSIDPEIARWYPNNLTSENGTPYEDFSNIKVMIFDRYGRLLATYNGLQNKSDGYGWDGSYNGKELPTGDYWYHIELNDSKAREFTGHFTLYRQ